MRQDLDDSGGRCFRVAGEAGDDHEQNPDRDPAHENKLAAGRGELNVELAVKCLFFPAEDGNMRRSRPMKTVLVIDDDAGFRQLLGKWLTRAGWRVLEAIDGQGGIQLAIQLQPDAVICNLRMPGCNGFQVCRSIRDQAHTIEQPKIIVTTGSVYATDQQNAIEVGADGCLVKPFKADELIQMLESRQGRRTTAASRPRPPPKAHASLPADQPTRLKFWGVRGSIPTPGPGTV